MDNKLKNAEKPGRNNLDFHFTLPVAVMLLFAGCGPPAQTPPQEQSSPVGVEIVQPRRGPITRFVTLPGEVKAFQQATLCAKVAGYLKTINVDKGDSVKQGTVLAEIEVPELLAETTKDKVEVEVAEIEYKRLSDSQKKAPDLVTPQTVDDARAKADIAKANFQRTETLLNYTKIVAPFSGIITRRMVDPGAFIPAATSSSGSENAALVTLADFSRVRLQVAVPEAEASLVTTGQPVKVSVEGLAGRSFDGKITRFTYALDEASKTMLAEIELPNPQLELRPGMYATVRIGIERKESALQVPAEAVLVEKAGASVFVLVDNKAKKTKVQTGFNDGTQIEVSGGLGPDDKIIIIGKRALTDGQVVSVSEHK